MVLVLMMMRWFNTTAVGIGGDDRGMFGRRWCRWCWWPQSENLRSGGNFWLVVVIVVVLRVDELF